MQNTSKSSYSERSFLTSKNLSPKSSTPKDTSSKLPLSKESSEESLFLSTSSSTSPHSLPSPHHDSPEKKAEDALFPSPTDTLSFVSSNSSSANSPASQSSLLFDSHKEVSPKLRFTIDGHDKYNHLRTILKSLKELPDLVKNEIYLCVEKIQDFQNKNSCLKKKEYFFDDSKEKLQLILGSTLDNISFQTFFDSMIELSIHKFPILKNSSKIHFTKSLKNVQKFLLQEKNSWKEIKYKEHDYTGQLNEEAVPHGWGKIHFQRTEESDKLFYPFKENDDYEGQWENGMPHGYGIASFYAPHWKDGVTEYYDPLHRSQEVDVYKGQFQNGKPCGKGILHYENGDIYQGHFMNGLPSGFGVLKKTDGAEFLGQWKKGKLNGHGFGFHPNHNTAYSGEWKDGLRNGYGSQIDAFGEHYEGIFDNNNFHGKGKLTVAEGDVFEGEWKHGVLTLSEDDPSHLKNIRYRMAI